MLGSVWFSAWNWSKNFQKNVACALIELPIVLISSSDALSHPLFNQVLVVALQCIWKHAGIGRWFVLVFRRCGWVLALVFRSCGWFLLCGKKTPSDFRPVGFSRRTLFCVESEVFMIFLLPLRMGFRFVTFGFLPIRVIFSTAFEFWVKTVYHVFFPIVERFKLSSTDLKPSDIRSHNCYSIVWPERKAWRFDRPP